MKKVEERDETFRGDKKINKYIFMRKENFCCA